MKKIIAVLMATGFIFGGNVIGQKKQSPINNSLKKMETKNDNSGIVDFDLNGMKVIIKPATNTIVSAQLFIKGGVANYVADKQGVEQLMLNVMADGGSQKYPKDSFHNITEKNGIYINGGASYDYSTMSLRTLVKNWDLAWDIFQDVIMNPSWDKQSFTQVQSQLSSARMQAESDPDEHLRDMSLQGIFKGTDYEKNPKGTPASLGQITLDDLKAQYKKELTTKNLVLVIVGNVSPDAVKQKLASSLGKLPQGTSFVYNMTPISITKPQLTVENRIIATNYIRGIMSAPALATKDNVAMQMAMAILSDDLFVEIRTKRNLSYAPAAAISSIFRPYSFVYVTTTDPDQSANVMMDEIRKFKNEGFSEKSLTDQKAGFLTNYYLGQESNTAQAITLGIYEIIKDWRYALEFKDLLQGLTTKEVNDAFKKYATNISWFYLGDESKMDKKVFESKL